MGSSSRSRSTQETRNSHLTTVDNSIDNSITDNSHFEDNSHIDSSFTDNSHFENDSSYTDNSNYTSNTDASDNSSFIDNSSSDFIDESQYHSEIDSSVTDNSVINHSADFTDNSSFTDNSDNSFNDHSSVEVDSSYTDNSVVTYLDGGAINAGRDVSMRAIDAVVASTQRTDDAYKDFAYATQVSTDSALKVASNIAQSATGGSFGADKMTIVALAVGGAILLMKRK